MALGVTSGDALALSALVRGLAQKDKVAGEQQQQHQQAGNLV